MGKHSALLIFRSFLSVFFLSPRPLPSQTKASLMVEMIIVHQKNYRMKLVEKLKKEYAKPSLMFDPLYFTTHHPCE